MLNNNVLNNRIMKNTSFLLIFFLLGLITFTTYSQSSTLIFNETFDNFDRWTPFHINDSGSVWDVTNGWAVIESMASGSGWVNAWYSAKLPINIPPGMDFTLKARIRVNDGDPSGWLGHIGVDLHNENGDRVARVNWNDSQSASGYGGLQFSCGGGMVYTNDPNGFSTNNPEFEGVLELRRVGSSYSAYLDGSQLGTYQVFEIYDTAYYVGIRGGQYSSYHYRDGQIDDIQIYVDTTEIKLPDLNERTILFGSNRTGNNEIFVMNIDDGIAVNITNYSADDRWARWSPNGDKIAFSSNRDGSFDIFTMNLDGSEIVNITNSAGSIEYFSWSPDGLKIVYAEHNTGDSEIWKINADGSGKTQITFNDTSKVDPEWSPDGSLIFYSQAMTPNSSIGNWQIFAMSPDRSTVYRLTYDGADNRNAVLSPDMKKIIYSSSRNGNTYCEKLWLADFNLTNGIPTISNDINIVTTGRQQKPSWSSNGSKIIYPYVGTCSSWATTLYIMDSDGSNQTQITTIPTDGGPDWFPNLNQNEPYPKVSCNHTSIELQTIDTILLKLYLENKGDSADHVTLDISVSENLEIINSLPSDKWSRYDIGSTIMQKTDEENPSLISTYLLYEAYEHEFGMEQKEYTITIQRTGSGDAWIKYRTAMNPKDVPNHNYNPDNKPYILS